MKELFIRPRRLGLYVCLLIFNILLAIAAPPLLLLIPLWAYLSFKAFKKGTFSFTDLSIEEMKSYDLKGYKKLLRDYDEISSFKEVAYWDEAAKQECVSMKEFDMKIESYLSRLNSLMNEEDKNNNNLPLLQKIFRYRSKERVIEQVYRIVKSYHLNNTIEDLEESIVFSPNNKEEQKEILLQMATRKDELTSEKRLITETMKDVRALAKLKNAQADNRFFASAQSKRYEKQQNRLEKEAAIAELENKKTHIQQRIYDLEKKISWVKKIKDVKEKPKKETTKTKSYDIDEAS